MKKHEKERLCTELQDIYDMMRNVALTKKHYDRRLHKFQRGNTAFEILLAIGTSSTVAGWTFWSSSMGVPVWTTIGIVIAVLTILKPILRLPAQIERFSILSTKYNALLIDLQIISFDIKSRGNIEDAIRSRFKAECEKLKNMGAKEDPVVSEKIRRKLCAEVNREIPAESFWYPT